MTNPLTVRALIEILNSVEPDRIVVFMTHYADFDESDPVCQVDISPTEWTYEQGRNGKEQYEVRYPGSAQLRSEGYADVVFKTERVVVLSDGPTNLRFFGETRIQSED